MNPMLTAEEFLLPDKAKPAMPSRYVEQRLAELRRGFQESVLLSDGTQIPFIPPHRQGTENANR